ncbi:hypothetical protein NPIL_284931 [Nephila pilipes]|uniref:Uncharacterized protein n=1 Tax=Nephila pilipes TaxID=299642 RepID=A0A8X6MZ95_NEPPI|nr:hypothetical protein NPIL_284931 [Nephila pilipes]
MSTEMEIAKQKRKAARATYSKTVNKLQEILAAESPDVDDLEIHLVQLTEKFKDLKTSDEIFLNLLQKKAGITQAEYEKEYEIAQDYYEKLSTFKIKVKKAIASAEKENGSSASPNPTWRPADGAHAATKAKQNLPEIRLPQFHESSKVCLEVYKSSLLTGFISRPELVTGTVLLESVLSSGYSVTTSGFPIRLARSLVSIPKGTVVGLVLVRFPFQFAV